MFEEKTIRVLLLLISISVIHVECFQGIQRAYPKDNVGIVNCKPPNPAVTCKNGGRCERYLANNYICVCASGWAGDDCSVNNPCLSNPCGNEY